MASSKTKICKWEKKAAMIEKYTKIKLECHMENIKYHKV